MNQNLNPEDTDFRTVSADNKGFTADLKNRLKNIRLTRWIRFAIVSVIFLFWVIWMGNPWLLLGWLLLIDIYLTCYIPWNWWKKSDNRALRSVMSWVDAIVYALVLVYFIFAFVGQNYKIPSSSLEKSLLVGDYLWVNKTAYGPRVPMTPLHFPLAQHTLPYFDTKSYIENPQIAYHRLPGLGKIERGDIVVFNFPQGDTVTTKIANPDYYTITAQLRSNGIADPKQYILSHPEEFGELVWRPVDRRENYVKRAIGLPGERLKISGDTIFINGKALPEPTNVQYNYIIPVSSAIPNSVWEELGVRREDHGDTPLRTAFPDFPYYNVPLTAEAKAKVEKLPQVTGPLVREAESGYYELGGVWPLGADYGWTRPNMGEFWIPSRGATLKLTLNNLPVYRRVIETYEGNKVEVRDGKIFINGAQSDYYTFKMDYYWMMGDNRDRSLDSRYWGLVPEDHIVGSPVFVLASFDEEKNLGSNIRWDRILRNANPDKESVFKK